MAATSVRLLGELLIEVNGTRVSPRGEVQRSLVALLALAAGRPVAAATLIERLWGEELPVNPRATLHSAMARLRRTLGDTVVTHHEGYELAIARADVDALTMADLFAAAEREDDPARKHSLLGQGIACWDEPFVGGFVDWLAQTEKASLTECYLTAVERWADLGRRLDQPDTACARLREVVAQHPLRESLWSRYLLALAADGRRADAVAQYEQACAYLQEELGVGPGAELRSALAVVTANPQPAEPVQLRQLPADLPRFFGRQETLAELDRLLLRSDLAPIANKVVVLHGEAGVGKTCVAVHWAHHAEGLPDDAHLFVDLAGYARSSPLTPDEALDEMLRAMGVDGQSIPPSLNGRSAMFRSLTATRPLVLVLDDARSAEQVRPLLPGGSSLVLITSRSRLDGLSARDGVHQVAVPTLRPEEARGLLRTMISKPTTAAHLDRLAELCSGLPLALAVASARVNRQPRLASADAVDRLGLAEDWLDLLTVADDPASDLRAVLDSSYRTLGPECARLFRAFGVIGHPLSTAGAAAAADLELPAATKALYRLTDLHLVTESAHGRYEQHALLSAFAREKAGKEDGDDVVTRIEARLLEWYLHTVQAASAAMGVPAGPGYAAEPPPGCRPQEFTSFGQAMTWYATERRYLVHAVVDGARRGHHRTAAQLALNLWTYLEQIWDFTDSAKVQQVALDAAKAAGDPLLEAFAANQIAISAGRSGDAQAACEMLRRALELFRQVGHAEGEGIALDNLGLALRLTGEYDESARRLEAALVTARRDGDELRTARLLNNLAVTQLALERFDEAAESATEAVRLHEAEDDWRGLAYAQDTAGQVRLAQQRPAEAIHHLEEAVRLATEYQLAVTSLGSRIKLGHAHFGVGNVEAARSAWTEALRLHDQLAPCDRERQQATGDELRELLAKVTG
ncbi:DNA-binding SARP family transcriptional activator [Kribbella amoyensis]|uniref:DNA-binding SARP family transcriptional activator n=1 Tax=Kribbella amoyensis TaxID=996641 RepID=A0A561BUI1_9ACTN|nr:AfsR/SARP family transcriptional regulator [Kribbella amoyensis]TWD82529.1 DNA-binding SARP family transcriptional activator [Kribbella amoyensis]